MKSPKSKKLSNLPLPALFCQGVRVRRKYAKMRQISFESCNMNNALKRFALLLFILIFQSAAADFIPAPNAQNLFYNGHSASNAGVGLWVAPINPTQRPGETGTSSSESMPQTITNVLNSAGPSQLLNNLFNSGLLNQVGVGVKVNF